MTTRKESTAAAAADNNNKAAARPPIEFKLLTRESIREARELASIEKMRLEIEEAEASSLSLAAESKLSKRARKRRKQQQAARKKSMALKPNKDLETGQRLPEKLREFMPRELFGSPIQEIDPFYRNQHVCSIRRHFRTYYTSILIQFV